MKQTFLGSLEEMSRVVCALILREMKTRFGRNRFGYVWALLEPIAYVAIFLAIRSQVSAQIPFGENLLLFLMTGLLVFRVFVSISGRGTDSIRSNKSMLAYPPVKPIDVILARVILEVLTMLVVLFVFFSFMTFTAESKIIINYNTFAAAISVLILLSTGLSIFNAVFVILWPTWDRIWGLIRLPLLLCSGVFYVPKSLPPNAQAVLQWNPVLHCVEWLRTSTYVTYDALLSKTYVISFAVILVAIGLGLERTQRAVIMSQ